MGVDAWGFDEERQAVARRLRSKRLRLGAVRTASFGVIAGILVFGGAAACRDLILSLGWPGWASVVTFLAVLFGVFAGAEVPFSYVGGFRWEHAIGLSTQTFAGWMKDLGKSLALGLGSTIVVGGVLLWLLATTPWWWLVGWVLGTAVSAVLGFLAPIVFVPLFFRFRPLQDERLRNRFVALPFRPVELWWSRIREARADRFSLELTRNPNAFAAAMVRLHDRNLGVAIPSRWEKWLFYSHPSGRERVAFARSFAASQAAGARDLGGI